MPHQLKFDDCKRKDDSLALGFQGAFRNSGRRQNRADAMPLPVLPGNANCASLHAGQIGNGQQLPHK
jgi:hypothetical protein